MSLSQLKARLSNEIGLSTQIEVVPTQSLLPPTTSARAHPKKQVKAVARSLDRNGVVRPPLVSDRLEVICGEAVRQAALLLGLPFLPVIKATGWSEGQIRAYRIADNKHAENSHWVGGLLAAEFMALDEAGIDLGDTGFADAEISIILGEAEAAALHAGGGPDDESSEVSSTAVTRPGDVWNFDQRHRLVCGDSQSIESFRYVLAGDVVGLIFSDPPWNVPINGHVSGLGRVRHREFAMACGEMSAKEFIAFLERTLGHAASFCRNGAIAYICMDWRHIGQLLTIGETVFAELKNLCVWNKSNAGMGSFYRSKHELVAVFKVGDAPHINNFGLGETGRHRTNVWDYAGVNTFKRGRAEELEMHPTVKPVALVADAIQDCSQRGDVALDPFGGSGTTLIAAEKTGRRARLIELDPLYCDVIVRRFQKVTGKPVTLANTGQTFEEVEEARDGSQVEDPTA